jgi:hypothetical protein
MEMDVDRFQSGRNTGIISAPKKRKTNIKLDEIILVEKYYRLENPIDFLNNCCFLTCLFVTSPGISGQNTLQKTVLNYL